MREQHTLSAALGEVKAGLTSIFGNRLENVLLYGSYARGEQDAESDIDILAVVDLSAETLDAYEDAVLDMSVALGLRYDALFSIILQDTATFYKYKNVMPFFVNVLREGISLV